MYSFHAYFMRRMWNNSRLAVSSFHSSCVLLILFAVFWTVAYIYATDHLFSVKKRQLIDKYSLNLRIKVDDKMHYSELIDKKLLKSINKSENWHETVTSLKSSHELLVSKNLPFVPMFKFRRLLTTTSTDRCIYSSAHISSSSSSFFPKDYFTLEQRRRGALFLHFFGLIYMFIAISIVSDEFFIPSLSVITRKLSISDNVAGATFMAAGSSAPEFFASLFGVFIAQNNIGIGTIVGSATFNILCVLAFCTFFSLEVLKITCWPMLRDIFFYVVALFLLVLFFLDEEIQWHEAISLFIIFIIYAIVMGHNEQLEKNFKRNLKKITQHLCPSLSNSLSVQEVKSLPTIIIVKEMESVSVQSKAAVDEVSNPVENLNGSFKTVTAVSHNVMQKNCINRTSNIVPENVVNCSFIQKCVILEERTSASEEVPINIAWPSSAKARLTYLFLAPIMFPLYYTLPDSKNSSSRKYFVITFVGSILWIAFFSYLMIWWAKVIGETLAIPNEIMGLTVLAAGTSTPDLISSVIVARKGLGDMAVSSSIGSNIFDICVGLPIPWLLQFAVLWLRSSSSTSSIATIPVISKGLICSVGLLFLVLIFLVIAVILCRWKLNKIFGMAMLIAYLAFCLLSVLLELGYIVCPLIIACK
ncbi:K+-dependent Na+/Ca+ exchanger family protein [Onchocerca flexuosa]|uniref:K+-dependent Na+/Ca+ exchanger family protein n=1 Tax=Onchocerca flexuosa TaxID=387005 RepID=A0A238BSQ7_9BILA|nr:K+-dependent Na+/Ca+ exchanger family protein [Onchocerca flexuosa]